MGTQSPTMDRLEAEWNASPGAGDAMNAAGLARFRALPLDEVRAAFRTTAGELRGYLTVVPEIRWIKDSARQDFFVEETLEHYQDHLPALQAILEAARSGS